MLNKNCKNYKINAFESVINKGKNVPSTVLGNSWLLTSYTFSFFFQPFMAPFFSYNWTWVFFGFYCISVIYMPLYLSFFCCFYLTIVAIVFFLLFSHVFSC